MTLKNPTLKDIRKLKHPDQIRLAAFAARRVVHLAAEIPEALAALEAAEGYLDRRVSAEECEKAADAAWATTRAASWAASATSAAWAAARAAAEAAWAASMAASAVDSSYCTYYAVGYALYAVEGVEAKAKLRADIWSHYDNLLNFDQYMLEGWGW
jgi:hypothetical protein